MRDHTSVSMTFSTYSTVKSCVRPVTGSDISSTFRRITFSSTTFSFSRTTIRLPGRDLTAIRGKTSCWRAPSTLSDDDERSKCRRLGSANYSHITFQSMRASNILGSGEKCLSQCHWDLRSPSPLFFVWFFFILLGVA